MRIGVPREIKDGERRVGLTPDGAAALVAARHDVVVETGAGVAVGYPDAAYRSASADIVPRREAVWICALVVKVKGIQADEYACVTPGTIVFGFAQVDCDRALLAAVLAARVTVLGFETVRDAQGGTPLRAPMSRIAGRSAGDIPPAILGATP